MNDSVAFLYKSFLTDRYTVEIYDSHMPDNYRKTMIENLIKWKKLGTGPPKK